MSPLIDFPVPTGSAQAAGPLLAYVGTFSSPLRDVLPTQVDLPPGNGRGIHLFRVDRDHRGADAGRHPRDGHEPELPGRERRRTRLYSANETDRVGDDKEGTVSAFAIDRADGKLKLAQHRPLRRCRPDLRERPPVGTFLLVANYFGGSVAVLPILADGRLGDATDVKTDAGKIGPTKATNAPPGSFAFSGHDRTHAHMIQADPVRPVRAARRPGPGQDLRLEVRREKGVLTAERSARVALPPGDGPRHFHFHPNGRWLYSIQEEGSTIVLFDYDADAGG